MVFNCKFLYVHFGSAADMPIPVRQVPPPLFIVSELSF